jgi:hypothetical protein
MPAKVTKSGFGGDDSPSCFSASSSYLQYLSYSSEAMGKTSSENGLRLSRIQSSLSSAPSWCSDLLPSPASSICMGLEPSRGGAVPAVCARKCGYALLFHRYFCSGVHWVGFENSRSKAEFFEESSSLEDWIFVAASCPAAVVATVLTSAFLLESMVSPMKLCDDPQV